MTMSPMNPCEWIRRVRDDERGAGIVTALMITLTIFALGATWTKVGIHQVESSSYERYREQALNAAEAGVNAAIGALAGDLHWAGTSSVVDLPDGVGQYEVEVTPVDPTDPDDLDRYIVARGYAPSKDAARRSGRQLEQQVQLAPIDGFKHALFASPGGIVGDNNSTITGDVYSAGNLTLNNQVQVFGSVTAVGTVTTQNNDDITKRVWAGKGAIIENSQTTVHDDVWAGGNAGEDVTIGGVVHGDVQAGGSVTVTGTVNGTISENNPPPTPPVYTQPTFTWDPANYPAAASWTSASNFMDYWADNIAAFSGHHRVNGGDDSSNKITLDQQWTMSGDVTIVANGPITLSRVIDNGTSEDRTLTVVSFSERDPAIQLTNKLTLPSSIKVLLFAPNGSIDFSQLKDFRGAVYGEEINTSQSFDLIFDPPAVPGFSWDATSAVHFEVLVQTFREVPFEPTS